MRALLLSLLLFQVNPARTGLVSGVVTSGSGIAAAGVRVYAVPAGDPNAVSIAGTVFVGLVQTDTSGRYRLEVPAGPEPARARDRRRLARREPAPHRQALERGPARAIPLSIQTGRTRVTGRLP